MSEQWSCPVCREKDTEIERITAELAALRESLRWKPVTETPTREGGPYQVKVKVHGIAEVWNDWFLNGSFGWPPTVFIGWREMPEGEGGGDE